MEIFVRSEALRDQLAADDLTVFEDQAAGGAMGKQGSRNPVMTSG